VVYFIWAQGEVQPWAIIEEEDSLNNSTEGPPKPEGITNAAFVSKDSS
jgi:hypothetical protein